MNLTWNKICGSVRALLQSNNLDCMVYNFLVWMPFVVCYVFVVFCRIVLFYFILYYIIAIHFCILHYGGPVLKEYFTKLKS